MQRLVYDNDLERARSRWSRSRKTEPPFRGAPVQISEDGTRILMAEADDAAAGASRPLFLRVNDHDLRNRPGETVRYVGSTADGRTSI